MYFGVWLFSSFTIQKFKKNRFSKNGLEYKIKVQDLLEIRLASLKDINIYFNWVNNIRVRKNSINSDEIFFDDHVKWFKNKLNSEDSVLLILENKGLQIGQIRFDLIKNSALIDYSIDEKYRGQGLGDKLLKMGMNFFLINFNRKKIKLYRAVVKKSNLASIKLFTKNGFIKKFHSNNQCFVYEKRVKI